MHISQYSKTKANLFSRNSTSVPILETKAILFLPLTPQKEGMNHSILRFNMILSRVASYDILMGTKIIMPAAVR